MSLVHVTGNHIPDLTEGISRNVHSLVGALRDQGYDAHLAAARNPLVAMNRRSSLVKGALHARRLAQAALGDPTVDAVHYHVSLASLAAFAPRRAAKPMVLHVWNALQEAQPRPASVELASDPATAPSPRAERVPGQLAHRVANGPEAARLALRDIQDIVVSSHYQARQLYPITTARLHVVPSGVDVRHFAPGSLVRREEARQRFGVPGSPVVLYYGHLSAWKGVDTLAAALPAVLRDHPAAGALFSVTGYGGDPRALAARLARLGVARQATVVGPAHVPQLHAAADIAVVPARAAVGTACHPNVLLESMAAGLAVVASAVGSIPEVVRHGENGLLVPPGDPAALAQAISLLAGDAALRRRLGQAARDTAVRSFRWEDAARRCAAIDQEAGAVLADVQVPAAIEVTA